MSSSFDGQTFHISRTDQEIGAAASAGSGHFEFQTCTNLFFFSICVGGHRGSSCGKDAHRGTAGRFILSKGALISRDDPVDAIVDLRRKDFNVDV